MFRLLYPYNGVFEGGGYKEKYGEASPPLVGIGSEEGHHLLRILIFLLKNLHRIIIVRNIAK